MKNKFIKALIIVLTLLLIVSIYQTSKYLSMTTKYNTMMSVYDKLPINSYIALKNQDMNLLSSDRPFDDKKINDLFDNIDKICDKKYSFYSYFPTSVNNAVARKQTFINSDLYDLYNFKIDYGRDFTKDDFQSNDVIPMIVGYDIRNDYKIGEVYTFVRGDKNDIKAKVIGYFSKDQNFASLLVLTDTTNNALLMPISENLVKNNFTESDFDMYLNGTVFELKNDEDAQKIEKLINDTKFYNVELKKLHDVLDDFKNKYIKPNNRMLIIFIAIDVILLASIVLLELSRFRKDKMQV